MTKTLISVDKLSLGLYVHMPSGYIDHPFMFNSFELKDKQQIVVIKKMGLSEIEIDPEKSTPQAMKRLNAAEFDPSAPRYVKPEKEKQKVELTLDQRCRKALNKAEQLYKNHLSTLQEIFALTLLDPEKSVGMADLLIGELQVILNNRDKAKICFINSECSGERIYQNALNTLVLTLYMAKELQLDLNQSNLLALVAVFHNFGEIFVPENIRLNNGQLTKPELNYLKQHPSYSYNKLKETEAFNAQILNTIASHHERLDGSGYPKKLKDKQLPIPVQLFSIVDAFEEMINNREQAKMFAPNIAALFMVKSSGVKFNAKLVDVLLKLTGIYPPGTLVKVQEQYGVVVFSNKGLVKQPIVKLYAKNKLKFLDCSELEQSNLECLKKQDVPEEVLRALNIPNATNFALAAL